MRMPTPSRTVRAIATVGMLVLAGCSGASSSSSGGPITYDKQITIAMVDHGSSTDPFWATVQRGATQAARDYNVKLDHASSGQQGSPSESALIRRAVQRHAQGIALTIPDAPAERSAIERAVQDGMPVVAFNVGARDWESVGAMDFIGQDPTAAGVRAGQGMASYGLRHLLCVIHEQDNSALTARCEGVAQALQAVGGSVVTITVPGADTAKSVSLIDQGLLQDPAIDGVLALGPPGFTAAQQALSGKKLPTKLPNPIASFDATAGILSAVAGGQALFAIDQQPYLQGYDAVQVLAQEIRFGLHPYQQIFTGPLIVDYNHAEEQAGYAGIQQRPVDYSHRAYVALVSHGPANDPFWKLVQAGARQAAHDFGVEVDYRSPDAQGRPSQATLIDRARQQNPDAVAVTLPDQSSESAVQYVAATYRPLVIFNAGEDSVEKIGGPQNLGALDFVGQNDTVAGRQAGQQLAGNGAHHVLCVDHDVHLAGLKTRCDAMAQVMAASGGSLTELTVDGTSVSQMRQAIGGALDHDRSIDTVMALGSPGFQGTMAALQATHRVGRIKVASFDASPDILNAVKIGKALFTINQQPYLQGYLAVEVLSQQIRLGVHPVGIVQTGPSVVTKEDAGRVLALERAVGI
jgi:simple sugar transport system substrate-binding protein